MIRRFFSEIFLKSNFKYFSIYKKWIIFSGIFLFFFLFNMYTPFVYDDIGYRYVHGTEGSFFDIPENATIVSDVNDVLTSTKALFFSWGGRLIFFGTAHFLFMFDKFWFNILNSAAAAAVIFMICKTAAGEKKVTAELLIVVSALFFLAAPSPGLTLFWANGAIVYLWTSLFYLILFYCYCYGAPRFFLIPTCILGMIACNGNENAAVTILPLLCLFILYTKKMKREIPVWMWGGLLGAVIGCAVLFGSPGVYKRILFENHPPVNILSNAAMLFAHLFHTIPGLFVMTAACNFLVLRFLSREQKILMCFYWLAALGTVGAMIFSPYIPGRALFCTFIFLLCIWGRCFFLLPESMVNVKRAFAVCVVSMALFEGGYALRDMRFTFNLCKNRMQCLQNAQKEGRSENWVFRPVIGMSRYNSLFKTDILREDAEHFLNRHYCRKYNQKSIRLSPVSAVQGMNSSLFPGGEE